MVAPVLKIELMRNFTTFHVLELNEPQEKKSCGRVVDWALAAPALC